MTLSQPTPLSTSVDLHGLTLTFQSENQTLRDRFELVYGHLPAPQESTAAVFINWTLHNESMAPLPPPNTPIISEDDLVNYYGSIENLIYIRMPKYGLIAIDLSQQQLTGVVTRNCLDVYGAFEDVLMISLAPLYRRRGWFPLHAFAALAPNDKAALITGAMGAGKTTTGLSLLDAGWKLLSNDSPLLCVRNDRIRVLSYPGRLSAFDDSLLWFENLKWLVADRDESKLKGRQKREFRAEDTFDDPWAVEGVAGGVFFPQVVPGLEKSELVPIAPTEAVIQLMPQAIEGWDKSAIGQNLQLLGKLVEQAPCYHLRLSPQVEQLPELIQQGLG